MVNAITLALEENPRAHMINVNEFVNACTLDIVARVSFGYDFFPEGSVRNVFLCQII